ncbi:MAG: hypothetical protein RMM58_07890 [Chloroflexota bacterium]|nr:hypothetical protein [Dehalococcoidia bacterium]MDW8253782.1 hypothetical protein [Chloroflexota bacterium]
MVRFVRRRSACLAAAVLFAISPALTLPAQSSTPALLLTKHPAPVLAEPGYPIDIFTDDFSTPTLDPGWYFIRQDADHWRTGPPEEAFQIITQQGDIYGAGATARNITLRGAPEDWEIRTKLTFDPLLPTQQAGLIFYESDISYVKLVRIALPPQFPGQGFHRVVMLYHLNDETKAVGELNVPDTTLYLRMRRVGGRVDGWWSADGVNWIAVATMLEVFVRGSVGLFAVNGNDNVGTGPTARYHWFQLYTIVGIGYDTLGVATPSVIKDGATYKMWFTGLGDNPPATAQAIGYAESPDGIRWTRPFTAPVFVGQGPPSNDRFVIEPTVLKEGPLYHMWYFGYSVVQGRRLGDVYYATSSDGINWRRENRTREGVVLPVLAVGTPGTWDDLEVRPGRVIREGATLVMYYTGRSQRGGIGIGRATSTDGRIWTKSPGPLIPNASNPRSVTRVGTTLTMLYSQGGRILASTSTDGLTWSPGVPVLGPGPRGAWDAEALADAWGIIDDGVLKVWYSAGTIGRVGYAQATSGLISQTFLPFAWLERRGLLATSP